MFSGDRLIEWSPGRLHAVTGYSPAAHEAAINTSDTGVTGMSTREPS